MALRTDASLQELLADPIVQMVMDSDRISLGEVMAVCEAASLRMQMQASGIAGRQMAMHGGSEVPLTSKNAGLRVARRRPTPTGAEPALQW